MLVFALALVGCKDRLESIDPPLSEEHATDVNTAESKYSSIYALARAEVENVEDEEGFSSSKNESLNSIDPCANISYNLSADETYIKTLTITYTDNSCANNGVKKHGKLKVFLNGKLKEVGTVMTIQPELFYVNGKKVEGIVRITNEGYNNNLRYVVTKEVLNGKVWHENSAFVTWDSLEELEIDFFNRDIYYSISSVGVLANGMNFSLESTQKLKRNFDCRYVQSGEIELNVNNSFKQIINYGNGACDSQATLTQGAKSKSFPLN